MLAITKKPLLYVVNKIDKPKQKDHVAEFFQLGVDRLIPISAKNNLGISELKDDLLSTLPSLPAAGTERLLC